MNQQQLFKAKKKKKKKKKWEVIGNFIIYSIYSIFILFIIYSIHNYLFYFVTSFNFYSKIPKLTFKVTKIVTTSYKHLLQCVLVCLLQNATNFIRNWSWYCYGEMIKMELKPSHLLELYLFELIFLFIY